MSSATPEHEVDAIAAARLDVQAAIVVLVPRLANGRLVLVPNMPDAFLVGLDLTRANLSHANLASANLVGADLRSTNISSANLVGANLAHANLADERLGFADLANADLTGTDLSGANLEGVRRVTSEQLAEAIVDAETVLPTGMARPAGAVDE